MPRPVVVCDVAAGEARIGGSAVSVRAHPGGALIVGNRAIRPLRFGERWRLLAGLDPGYAVGAAVLAVAATRLDDRYDLAGTPPPDEEICQVLALHLAGARPQRAVPGCARQLADLVAAGWAPREVLDTDADLIDLLAESLGEQDRDDGWTSIVLTAEPGPVSVSEVLVLLEQDLLGRLEPGAHDHPGPADDHRLVTPITTTSTLDPRTMITNLPPGPDRTSATMIDPATLDAAEAWLHPSLIDAAAINPSLISTPSAMGSANGMPAARPRPTPSAPSIGPAPIMIESALDHPTSVRRQQQPADLLPTPGQRLATAPDHDWRSGRTLVTPSVPARSTTGAAAAPAVRTVDGTPAAVGGLRAPAAGRVGAYAARTPEVTEADPPVDVFDLADQLATLLDEESDLRGLLP